MNLAAARKRITPLSPAFLLAPTDDNSAIGQDPLARDAIPLG